MNWPTEPVFPNPIKGHATFTAIRAAVCINLFNTEASIISNPCFAGDLWVTLPYPIKR